MIFFYMWSDSRRTRVLESFAQGTLLGEISKTLAAGRRKIKLIMIMAAILCVLIAFIQPQWGFKWQEVKKQGLDILIALDTSNSMLAEDVLPNRLARSKLAIKDLVKKLQGDRIGLIAFSGTAFLQCPLTVDYNGFLLSLQDIAVDTIPVGGTSLSRAIYTAVDSYEGGAKKNKILIIITDGEDLEGGVEESVMRARSAGITIYCVGIGTAEGELIPMMDARGKMTFLKDAAGDVVKTRLDEKMLQEAALDTGGIYVRSTGALFGLDLIYDRRLSKLEKEEFKSRMEKKYNERFQMPLWIALLLLLVEPLIGDRRKGI
ncbi:MAG: VWA domain-containing protein [Candidatus Omnitrophica bacterium]|nr:VWA domain-containing protein [Candidatus Omnitrophota bacterium]